MNRTKHQRKLLGSGILLALSSSLCCIVPLLALLGTTGSALSMFSWIAPLRPFLLAATAIVLLVAFYRAYKPVKKDDCGCAEKKTGMQSKTFLWIVTIISIGLSSLPYYITYLEKQKPKTTIANTQHLSQIVFEISGMSCAACEGHVNRAVQQQKGVQQVSTSYEKGESNIKFDSSKVSLKQLARVIQRETGYKVININSDVQ